MRRIFLRTASLLPLGLALASAAPAYAAFDPNSGEATASTNLPDPAVIYSHTTVTPGYISPLAPVQMPAQPLYPSRMDTPAAANVVAPAAGANIAANPISATPIDAPAAVAVTTTTVAVPVNPVAVPVNTPPAEAGFIAPAPVLAENPLAQPNFPLPTPPAGTNTVTTVTTTTVPAPEPITEMPEKLAEIPANPPIVASTVVASAVAAPAPETRDTPTTPAIVAAPIAAPVQVQTAAVETQKVQKTAPKMAELDPQTRTILSHIPGHIDQPKPQAGGHIDIQRVSPDVKDLVGKTQEDTYQATGISIKVSRPGLDENFELNRAYTALMGNDTGEAIEIYKNILSANPKNQDALFGLAATYHRMGELDKARPLYGMLLQLNPNHREGLNNFLVLVSDESPQDALPELERLEARNPTFSPIPAQIAVILDKMGYAQEARERMLHAIELAPDNLTYKYNLAVMLDRQGQSADAVALYSMLIDSALHGQPVPADVSAMQKRVNYLTVAMKNPPKPAAKTTVSDASGVVN